MKKKSSRATTLKVIWDSYFRTRSQEARNRIAEEYMPDVPKIVGAAIKGKTTRRITDGMLSSASLALITSIETYDPARAKFDTHLHNTVKHALAEEDRRSKYFRRGPNVISLDAIEVGGTYAVSNTPQRLETSEVIVEAAEKVVKQGSRIDRLERIADQRDSALLAVLKKTELTKMQQKALRLFCAGSTVSEIAEKTGTTAPNVSKTLKKMFGCSATQMRKNMDKKRLIKRKPRGRHK